jgi:large repetitive protein
MQIFSRWFQGGGRLFTRLGDGRVWALAVLLAAASLPAAQAATRAFTPRFTLNAAGDITIAANSSLTCSTVTGATGAANCVAARNGTAAALTNNSYTMINVDVDANTGTVNSSAARLLLNAGSSVAFAGLYWGGVTNNAATTALRGAVALATPLSGGGYTTITASVTNDTAAAGAANGAYQSFADVTGIVASAGAGTYTVANVAATSGVTNVYAGWSLVVVFRDATQPTRNMVVYDGYQVVSTVPGVDISLSGFTTPPSGTVTSKLGVVGYDGDRGSAEAALGGLLFGHQYRHAELGDQRPESAHRRVQQHHLHAGCQQPRPHSQLQQLPGL